jgi:hypothetical protein
MTVHQLVDVPAARSTALSKAFAEQASGIGGCTIGASGATGTPAQGNLSRVLAVDSYYLPTVATADSCEHVQKTGVEPPGAAIATGGRGNLLTIDGVTIAVKTTTSDPLVLRPGDGACIAVSAFWQKSPATTGTPATPVDAAAQGDSLTFGLRFDVTQV